MLSPSLLINLGAAYIMSLYSVVVNYNYAHQDNYVNMGLSHLFLVLFFPLPWYIVGAHLIKLQMIVYWVEEGVCTILLHGIRKSPTPIDCNSELKNPKSFPGFNPGLLRQNAVALPLAPPPLPWKPFFAIKQVPPSLRPPPRPWWPGPHPLRVTSNNRFETNQLVSCFLPLSTNCHI